MNRKRKLAEKRGTQIRFDENLRSGEIIVFCIPLIISGFFSQAGNLINAGLLSRAISPLAAAVSGACAVFGSLQSYLAVGMTTGFGIYLSRCYGKEDKELYQKSVSAAFFSLGIMEIFALLLLFFLPLFMRGLQIPEELWTDSRNYLLILFLGTGFLGSKNLLIQAAAGMGEAKISGIAETAGVIIQTASLGILLYIFQTGIWGVTFAILIKNLLLTILLLIYMKIRQNGWFRFTLPWKTPLSIWKELLANGFSKSTMMLLVGIGGIFMQRAKNGLPEAALAGSSYADTLSNFLLVPLSALATAASVAAGQNVGRKSWQNISRCNHIIFRCYLIASAVATVIAWLFGRQLLLLMTGTGAQEDLLQSGVLWLAVVIPAFFGLGLAMICRNCLQAMGSYRRLIALGVLEMCVTIFFAVAVVPGFGYLSYCIFIAVNWTLLGAVAWIWYRKRYREVVV